MITGTAKKPSYSMGEGEIIPPDPHCVTVAEIHETFYAYPLERPDNEMIRKLSQQNVSIFPTLDIVALLEAGGSQDDEQVDEEDEAYDYAAAADSKIDSKSKLSATRMPSKSHHSASVPPVSPSSWIAESTKDKLFVILDRIPIIARFCRALIPSMAGRLAMKRLNEAASLQKKDLSFAWHPSKAWISVIQNDSIRLFDCTNFSFVMDAEVLVQPRVAHRRLFSKIQDAAWNPIHSSLLAVAASGPGGIFLYQYLDTDPRPSCKDEFCPPSCVTGYFSAKWHPDGDVLFASSMDRTVDLIRCFGVSSHANRMERIASIPFPHDISLRGLRVSPQLGGLSVDGCRFVVPFVTRGFQFVRMNGRSLEMGDLWNEFKSEMIASAWSADGQTLFATFKGDRSIHVIGFDHHGASGVFTQEVTEPVEHEYSGRGNVRETIGGQVCGMCMDPRGKRLVAWFDPTDCKTPNLLSVYLIDDGSYDHRLRLIGYIRGPEECALDGVAQAAFMPWVHENGEEVLCILWGNKHLMLVSMHP